MERAKALGFFLVPSRGYPGSYGVARRHCVQRSNNTLHQPCRQRRWWSGALRNIPWTGSIAECELESWLGIMRVINQASSWVAIHQLRNAWKFRLGSLCYC